MAMVALIVALLAAPPAPVVVELLTSEGCSSCPPADALLRKLVAESPGGVQLLGFEEHVDYWDGLGWRDPYSQARFTERQRDYGDRLYTPQMVVDGAAAFVGSNERAALAAIASAAARPKAPLTLAQEGATIWVEVAKLGEPAKLMLAVVEDGLVSKVAAGENKGRTLIHAAVARSLQCVAQLEAGQASAKQRVALEPTPKGAHLRAIAFVQSLTTRRVLAAGSLQLK